MSSAVDSRGITRGRCHLCSCNSYQAGTQGQKCAGCAHPPTKHDKLSGSVSKPYSSASQPQSYAATVGSTGTRHTTQQRGYGARGGRTSPTYSHHQEPVTQPPTQPCKARGCYKLSHYDPRVGEFDYCSPSCRDKDLLSKEKKRLLDDLKAFEDELKRSTQVQESQKHVFSQGPTRGSSPHETSAVYPSGSGSQSQDKLRGQKTVKVIFQKSPLKDVGFIVAHEEFRRHTFSGILVLGFEYNTKAEHLFERGEIHLLDVITSLNEKEACLFTYPDEMQKGACTLVVNRSIALPEIKNLMEKAKFLNPTYLVAVMNPRDIPYCSTEKGFGFDTQTSPQGNIVSSATENTPARFSRLKYGDEIVAYGFVKDNKLQPGRGYLSKQALDDAASDGKTVVLVLKRKT